MSDINEEPNVKLNIGGERSKTNVDNFSNLSKPPLTYTDNEGNRLFGYSVEDVKQYNKMLNLNTQWTKRLVFLIGVIGLIGIFYILWLTNYIIKNNVVNNIVANCV